MDSGTLQEAPQGQQQQPPLAQTVPMRPDRPMESVQQPLVPQPRESPQVQQVARPVEQPMVSQVGLPPVEDEAVQVVAATPAPVSTTASLKEELQAMPGGSAPAPQATQVVASNEAVVSSGQENVQQDTVVPQEVAQVPQEVQPSIPEVRIPEDVASVVQESYKYVDTSGVPLDVLALIKAPAAKAVVAPENTLGIKTLPESYKVAIKTGDALPLTAAKKWLFAKVALYWERINPTVYKRKK